MKCPMVIKEANAGKELGEIQLKEQKALYKLMMNKDTTRKQYMAAGLANENYNIERILALPWHKRIGRKTILKRVLKKPDVVRRERFGRSWDRVREISREKYKTRILAPKRAK